MNNLTTEQLIYAMKQAMREFAEEKKTYTRNSQNKYSLEAVYCTAYPKHDLDLVPVKPDNALYLEVNRPFIHLDTQVIDNSIVNPDQYKVSLDSDSRFKTGVKLNNHLCYLQDHPAIYIAQFADMNSFISPAGVHMVPDYRLFKDDVTFEKQSQIAFILKLNDYV